MRSGKRKVEAVSPGAMASRFKTYLKEPSLDDTETVGMLESLHGLRAGGLYGWR